MASLHIKALTRLKRFWEILLSRKTARSLGEKEAYSFQKTTEITMLSKKEKIKHLSAQGAPPSELHTNRKQ